MTDPRPYRKKPVVIHAMQWDGTATGATAIIRWLLAHDGTARYHDEANVAAWLAIDTLEGTMRTVRP